MNFTDTLSATKSLKKSGFSEAQSEALAAQQEATAQEIVANIGRALDARFAAFDAKFEARFVAIDARFAALDAKFEARFVAMDARLEIMESRFAHIEARLDAKIESVARDQLFKIVIMLFSSAGLTVAFLSFLFAMMRP